MSSLVVEPASGVVMESVRRGESPPPVVELFGPNSSSVACSRGPLGPFHADARSGAKRSPGAAPLTRATSCASTPLREEGHERLHATMPAFSAATARRSATPIQTRTAHQALGALAESVSASVTTLQQQADADRRRMTALERRLDAAAEERTKDTDWRDRLAEVQGSVAGLLDEAQAQARRVDGLEERLWMKSGSSEGAKQRSRELEQRLQALEQQSRHGILSLEEVHKRQSTRLCRAEKASEDMAARFAAVEEAMRCLQHSQQNKMTALEERLVSMEQQNADAIAEVQSLQVQLAQKSQADSARELPTAAQIDEALQMLEKSTAAIDKRLCSQVEELSSALASLRVKVDGGHRRLAALAERFEVTQQSASEGFREELLLLREQDKREHETTVSNLRDQLQHVADESTSSIQSLRKAQLELGKMSSTAFEADAWRAIEESVNAHAQELATLFVDVGELRALTEPLIHAGLTQSLIEQLHDVASTSQELSTSKTRLQALEDWKSMHATAAEQESRAQANLATAVSETTSQLSQLSVRVAQTETSSSNMLQSLRVLQEQVAFKDGQDGTSEGGSAMAELDAKVEVMSHRVADMVSRVLEVEGALEFARHAEQSIISTVPSLKEAWAPDQEEGASSIKPEVLSSILERVAKLELNAGGASETAAETQVQDTPPRSAVKYQSLRVAASPGSDAASCSAPIQLDFLSREVGELHARLRAVELDAQSMRVNFLKPEAAVKVVTPTKAVSGLEATVPKGYDADTHDALASSAVDLSALSTTMDCSAADVSCSAYGESFAVDSKLQGSTSDQGPILGLEEVRKLATHAEHAVKDASMELYEVRLRLSAAEQGVEELRQDVDTMRAHQVAEDLALHAPDGGGQAVKLARDMLDSLCEQVADLQKKMEESSRVDAQEAS